MDKNIPINELTNFLFEPHLCCSSLISFMPQHLLPFSPPPSLVSLWVRLILESYKNLKYWHPIWDKDIVWDPQTRSFSEGGNSSRDVSHKQVIIQYVLKRGKKKKRPCNPRNTYSTSWINLNLFIKPIFEESVSTFLKCHPVSMTFLNLSG